ncbi:MAG: PAS domain-containing sensor histidine kinase [Pseudomonadota bacterium]
MWRNERLGLVMIVASLLVMGVVLFLLFDHQRETRLTQARNQGIGLARVLGGMPWQELAPESGGSNILQALRQGQNNPDFAYAVLVDVNGKSISESTVSGIIIPNIPIPNEPAAWMGERVLEGDADDASFIEFHAPIFSASDLRGYVRLGYHRPELGFRFRELPFFATLVLPVFLLMPLFYFLLRHEIRPLRKMNENLEQMLDDKEFNRVELHPSGELGEFMERFMQYANSAQNRIQELQDEQNGLLMSSKLLSYRHSRIESVLQTLPEAILLIDEAGMVSFANEKIKGLLGIRNEEVIGKRPQEWCQNPNLIAYLSRHSKDQVGYICDSIQITPKNDADKHLEIKAYPLFSPKDNTNMLGHMVVIRDATEEQLARRSRGEFVAQVAHELKTPLNVLAMYSESLLGEDGNDETFRIEAVNVIHDEVERLSTLINNLLAITQFELGGMQLNRTRVRLHELLEDAFKNVSQSGRGKGLQFNLDLPREMSAAYVDKDLLRIAVNNLLTNAIKYNRPNGVVTLTAEEINGAIEISIKDDGIGISQEDQQKIFEKFFRSDDDSVREQTGHGLGLSLVQQIVHMHHGALSLQSEYGKGSAFTIRIDKDAEMMRQAGVA